MEWRELSPRRTPLDYPSVVNALLLAWGPTGAEPSRAAVRLAAAQIAVETGLANCMNFNISGIKSRPNNGRSHWQYFATTEIFTADQVRECLERNPPGTAPVLLLGPVLGKQPLTKVKVFPKHPYCCFRAFETLDAAMADHLATMRKTFAHGLEGLLTGDPVRFARGLKRDGYYTAPESEYAAGLTWRLRELAGKVTDGSPVWGDVT